MQEPALTAPLDWDDARMFLAVARAGQMLGASRALGINQATLSRRIAALEAALGAKLLARRTHGSELTDAGQALFGTLERVETEMLAVQARLQGAEAAAAASFASAHRMALASASSPRASSASSRATPP